MRKILIFIVLTAGIILLGKLAPRVFPFDAEKHAAKDIERDAENHGGKHADKQKRPPNTGLTPDGLRDSTNALPAVEADTTGGRWHEKLFEPLERGYGLNSKSIRQKKGFWEVVFPKGKPIHEYAFQIEAICRANGIIVEQGVELRPANRSVEYLLQSNGHQIRLRASLGNAFMAGSARIAIVFVGLDSLDETELAALESAAWEKTLVVDPHCANPVLKKLRFTQARNEVLVELPMEPTSYPFVDPGKHALFIHHSPSEVEKILSSDLDSLPKAAGFASRLGDRAIENQPLLEKLFRYTAAKGLLFLDLTGSPRSLARQTAAVQGARSRSLTAFKDDMHMEEELARKAAQAQKTGEAILVIRYSAMALRILAKSLEANAIRFNEMGLELVTLSTLVSEPDTLNTTASTPASPAVTPVKASKPSTAKPAAAKPGDKQKPVAGAKPSTTKDSKSPPASKPNSAKQPHATKTTTANPPAKVPAKAVPKTPAKPTVKPLAKPTAKPMAKPAVKAKTDTGTGSKSKTGAKP